MQKWIIPTLCLLVAVAVGYLPGRLFLSAPSNGSSITPDEVLWATGIKFWKIDLENAGVFYGLSLVHIDQEGHQKDFGQMINPNGFDPQKERLTLLVALKRDQHLLSGKYGFTKDYATVHDLDVFQSSHENWYAHPVLDGDLYYLASVAKTANISKPSDEQNSNRIAIKLHRQP